MKDIPTITLCYTTVRPACIADVVKKWLSRALFPANVMWAITTDADRPEAIVALREIEDTIVRKGSRVVMDVVTDLPGTCVKGWNLAAEIAEANDLIGDIIIAVADDFDPPSGWDQQLASIGGDWWKKEKVVHVADGYNPNIFTLAILSRPRFEKFRYLFYPAYESLFSDTEFTFAAHADDVVIEATHLLFEHLHPDCGKRPRDANDLHHASKSRWATGEMLFNYRQSIGFPVDAGPTYDENPIPVVAKDLAVYIQAVKDDFCLFEVCERLYEEGARTFFFYIPDEYWSGKLVSEGEISQVKTIADALSAKYTDATCRAEIFQISKHRVAGRSRIQVETHARNEALEWIRSCGFKHILIADGDELWRRGLMSDMITVINDHRPNCIYTGMVPVVGLPGYPIGGAIDKASIYVGKNVYFSECRGTFGSKYELKGHSILHFTATRRTMEEIIQKSRDSGHYDDPTYDFEGWIKNILPIIRPGLENVHMYRPYNPWKIVREWTTEEVAEIPSTLHKFLSL